MGLKESGLRGSLRSVSTGVIDIPDSAIAHYDTQSAFDSGDDGQSVSTWQDELGQFDATDGNPTVRENGINGNRSLEFGTDDGLDAAMGVEDGPMTVLTVAESFVEDDNIRAVIAETDGDGELTIAYDDRGLLAFRGELLEGNTGLLSLTTVAFDGSNAFIRQNGAQTDSGNVGDENADLLSIGYRGEDNSRYWDGYIGEILLCDGVLSSSEIDEQESRMASRWDISI